MTKVITLLLTKVKGSLHMVFGMRKINKNNVTHLNVCLLMMQQAQRHIILLYSVTYMEKLICLQLYKDLTFFKTFRVASLLDLGCILRFLWWGAFPFRFGGGLWEWVSGPRSSISYISEPSPPTHKIIRFHIKAHQTTIYCHKIIQKQNRTDR